MRMFVSVLAVIILSWLGTAGDLHASVPGSGDITWTAHGGLEIAGWMVIEDDYGTESIIANEVIKQDRRSITYRNTLVEITKSWTLENGLLTINSFVKPLCDAGRHSELKQRVKSLRNFDSFYTPYAFSSPEISGKWIPAGQMPELRCGYRGANTNSMMHWMLIDDSEGAVFARTVILGYPNRQGGIEWSKGDYSEILWPIAGYSYFDGHYGHPTGPKESGWLENEYPAEGGDVQYAILFKDDISKDGLAQQGEELTSELLKQFELDVMCPDWQDYHQDPKERIGFFAFVGASWGERPNGGTGSLRERGEHYVKNLKRMRKILDDHGMADAQIYYWVQLYDDEKGKPGNAGWGVFPLDRQEINTHFNRVRQEVHDVKFGLYAHLWYCWDQAPVYKQHPEWFTRQKHGVDSGGSSYEGKLPYWGDYLASKIPGVIKTYGLDFVFYDGANWAPRWNATHKQCQDFFKQISSMMHENNALFIANSRIPYVDIGMYEIDAGNDDFDRAACQNYQYFTHHKQFFSPFYAWRTWQPEEIEKSGQNIVKYYADHPQFVARWPLHLNGEMNERMLKEHFPPWVKRRALLTQAR